MSAPGALDSDSNQSLNSLIIQNLLTPTRIGKLLKYLPMSIKMSTIMRDSGTLEARENYENVRRIDEALDELKEKKILLSFEKDIVRGKRNCIVDIKYTMLPTVEFIGEIKRANSRAQKLDEMLSSRSDS